MAMAETFGAGLGGSAGAGRWLRSGLRAALVAANLVGGVALLGMVSTETIDNDIDFAPRTVTEGGLYSVDMAAALIEREASENAWVSNEPFFMPGHYLRNMQAFQQGLMYGLSRFTFELADSLGRSRGSTAVDPDLDRAAGLLRFPGDVWIFDLEKTWTPTVTSEEQYTSAARALLKYNARVASGEALFDPRNDNLQATIARIEADISSQVNVLAEHVEKTAAGIATGTSTNDVFYALKGRMYAYAMILTALEQDFADVIRNTGASLVWERTLASLRNAAVMRPLVVMNGTPGSMTVPSHVAELGFFVLRAKTQLRDVMAVLQG
jgi:hypothetical protein